MSALSTLKAREARLVRDLSGPSHGLNRPAASKELKAVRAEIAKKRTELAAIGDAVVSVTLGPAMEDLKRRVLAIQEGMR